MISIVIGELGSTIATGIIMVGIETIIGVIGQGKNFIGHHQVILAIEGLMANRVVQGMEDLRVSRAGLTGNRVGQDLVGLRASRAEGDPMEKQAEGDLTLKCMDHRVKQVDLDLSPKWLEDLAEAGLMANRVVQGMEDLRVNS